MSQLAVAMQLGQTESIRLCLQNIISLLVGEYPVSQESIQYKTGLLLWDMGQAFLEHTVVDARFLQRYDFDDMGAQCTDRAALTRTLETFVSEAGCYSRTLSATLTKELLLNVQQYLRQKLRDPNLSVTAVADYFHVNRTTLSTKFQQFFGIGMAQYIQTSRVALAKSLLRDHPELSLEAVASQSGFSAVSTMYRVFMRMEGSSPGNFRSK
jgi:AraC-like DNA-binding protein